MIEGSGFRWCVCVYGHRVSFKLGISSKTYTSYCTKQCIEQAWKLMRYWGKVIEDGLPFSSSSSLFWIFGSFFPLLEK